MLSLLVSAKKIHILEESPVFARDVNLCLVKDEKTLNKEAPIQILDKVPLPLVKGIPSPGTKGLHAFTMQIGQIVTRQSIIQPSIQI